MYDPIDMAWGIPDPLGAAIPAEILRVAVVGGERQSDADGNLDYWNHSWYNSVENWPRRHWDNHFRPVSGNNTTIVDLWEFDASHCAIGGHPGYNDTRGEAWLAAYDYDIDKNNSIEADRRIRETIRALGIDLRDELPTDYPYPQENPTWKP